MLITHFSADIPLKEKKESYILKYLSLLSIRKLAKTTKDVLCMTTSLIFCHSN